jgi:hypothetical protein
MGHCFFAEGPSTWWTNALPEHLTFATADGEVHHFDPNETKDLDASYDDEIHVVVDGVLVGGVTQLRREPEEPYRRQPNNPRPVRENG